MSDPLARARPSTPSLFDELSQVVGPTKPTFAQPEIQVPAKRGHAPMAATSIDARRAVETRLKPQQLRLMRALIQLGKATSDDLVAETGMPPNVVAPRLAELRDMRWAIRLDERQPTRSGVSAFVHVATAEGLAQFERQDHE